MSESMWEPDVERTEGLDEADEHERLDRTPEGQSNREEPAVVEKQAGGSDSIPAPEAPEPEPQTDPDTVEPDVVPSLEPEPGDTPDPEPEPGTR